MRFGSREQSRLLFHLFTYEAAGFTHGFKMQRAVGSRSQSVPTLKWCGLGSCALVLLIQLVPYGHAHSNLTKWRWYSNVAPSSWLVEHDVEDGRAILNFSEWNKPQPDAGELIEKVENGEIPPLQYKVAHGDARLSSREKKQLVSAITSLYAADPPPRR
jgi:hypothetical protein